MQRPTNIADTPIQHTAPPTPSYTAAHMVQACAPAPPTFTEMVAAQHAAERAHFRDDLDGEGGQAMLQRQMEEGYAAQRQDYETSLQQQQHQQQEGSSSSPTARGLNAHGVKRGTEGHRDYEQAKRSRR